MASTNRFIGLARGPIDHNASSVINSVSGSLGIITMGSVVILDVTIPSSAILPSVNETTGSQGSPLAYGIAVGGDTDGIYGDGTASTDDKTRATTSAGQGVVVVTQGRCPARVTGVGGPITVGLKLTPSAVPGVLELAISGDQVIATALQGVLVLDTDIIAVDVQREGLV